MTDLSPELQRLVSAGKVADQPTVADRERVFASLASRLPQIADTTASTHANPLPSRPRALATRTAAMTAAALTLLTAGYLAFRSPPAAEVKPPIANTEAAPAKQPDAAGATVEKIPPAPAPEPAQAADTPPADLKLAPQPSSVSPRTNRDANRSSDSLAKEVAILSRAQAALHSGRAADTLQVLAEHERQFPRGILAEERRATKIQALCALGRTREANALLGTLGARSVTGESARQACASPKR